MLIKVTINKDPLYIIYFKDTSVISCTLYLYYLPIYKPNSKYKMILSITIYLCHHPAAKNITDFFSSSSSKAIPLIEP